MMKYLDYLYNDGCIFKINIKDISMNEISIDYLIYDNFCNMITKFKSMNLESKYQNYIKIDIFSPKMIGYKLSNRYSMTAYELKEYIEKICYHRELYISPDMTEIYGERYYIKTGIDIYIDYGILYGNYDISKYSTGTIFKSSWFKNSKYTDIDDNSKLIIIQDILNINDSIFSISNDYWLAIICSEYRSEFNRNNKEFRRPELTPPISTIQLL